MGSEKAAEVIEIAMKGRGMTPITENDDWKYESSRNSHHQTTILE